MSGYVGDLTAAQEDTLRWMQRTLREEADKPGFLETVPSNYFDEVADDCACAALFAVRALLSHLSFLQRSSFGFAARANGIGKRRSRCF